MPELNDEEKLMFLRVQLYGAAQRLEEPLLGKFFDLLREVLQLEVVRS